MSEVLCLVGDTTAMYVALRQIKDHRKTRLEQGVVNTTTSGRDVTKTGYYCPFNYRNYRTIE